MGDRTAVTATPTARATARRWLFTPGWLAVALLLVPFALGLRLPLDLQLVPLLLSLVVLGLPHGAVDHLVPARLRTERSTVASAAQVGLLYLVVGGAYAVVWFTAPLVAFWLFILLTWLHWGQGDVHALVAVAGASHLRTTGQRIATALVRGGLPMLVPLVAFPDQYRRVATALVSRFGGSTEPAAWLFASTTRLGVGLGFLVLVVGTLAVGYRRDRAGTWRVDASETLLLGAFFATVPPLVAIGVYFSLWHAARHVARLALLDPPSAAALDDEQPGRAIRRFYRQATPLTLAAIGLLVGFYWLVPVAPTDVEGLVALYLVLVAVLTLPHVVVVTWMDRIERVWTGYSSSPR